MKDLLTLVAHSHNNSGILGNIFNIFFSRNIKDKKIKTKSFLIDLVKAEFILAKWACPIPSP